MNWRVGLDRWLTTPPEDPFDGLAEQVWNKIPESLVSDYEYELLSDLLPKYEDFVLRQYLAGYYRTLDEVADVLGRWVRHTIDKGMWTTGVRKVGG